MQKLFTPIIAVYIATILSPKDYGLVAISSVFIGFASLLQGFGMKDFIVKEETINDEKLSAAFWLNIFISIFFYLIFFAFAGLIATIYEAPLLRNIVRIGSIVIILEALGTVQLALLRRNMEFKKLFFIRLVPFCISLGVVLPMAHLGYGVWALVAGQVARSFIINLIYWLYCRWIPKFLFDKSNFLEVFKFGKWIVVERSEEYLMESLGIMILGYFGNVSMVGIFSVAKYIVKSALLMISAPIQNIALPLLSRLHYSNEDLLSGFYKIMNRLMLLILPLIAGVILLSHDAITLIFQDKWDNLAIVVSILILGKGLIMIFGTQRELYKILGQPDLYPKSIFFNLMFSVVVYPIAINYGFIVFLFAILGNDFLFIIIQMTLLRKQINFSLRKLFINNKESIISMIVMSLAILLLNKITLYYEIEYEYYILCFFVIFGIAIYAVCFWCIEPKKAKKVKSELMQMIR